VRLVRTANGKTVVQKLPAFRSGPGAALQTIRTPKDTYVIPLMARPYLNRFLDPALFDVTKLAAAGAHGKIPIRIAFGGSQVPAVPGLTVTAHSAGSASGYLTAASAHRFGAALAAQYRADYVADFPQRATLFGVTRILTGSSTLSAVSPQYPMRTLIIKALNRSGKPERLAFLTVINTDNLGKYVGFPVVINGAARISVPKGTYAIQDDTLALDKAGNFSVYDVYKTGIQVSRQDQTSTVDARSATSLLSVRTPQPGIQQSVELELEQADRAGGLFFSGIGIFGEGRIYVAPTTGRTPGLTSSTS